MLCLSMEALLVFVVQFSEEILTMERGSAYVVDKIYTEHTQDKEGCSVLFTLEILMQV